MSARPSGRVLVVDDEPDFRRMIAQSLGEEGFEVLEAANGLEALLQIKRERPAAVLLDLRMPRLGGLEVLRRLRGFDPSIKVLIVTGFPEDVGQEGAALGAAVLTKPVRMSMLLGALRQATTPDRATARRPAQVLIVDDDREVGETLVDCLTALGYEARWISGGADAVRALTQAPPDLVILDILMPGLSGLQALPSFRALAPGVPVIMVSGTGDEALARQALAHGAFDYVVKPVDLRHLEDIIELALVMGGSSP